MKVAIFGGYGVFGSRLAELLIRDGHAVFIIGRKRAAAEGLAAKLGGSALQLDRAGDLAPLWARSPDAVVDAAGPFHAYGADPYRLAKSAIAQGVSYLDLADDAEFCAGIAVLDAEAKAAGVFALSGMSSVPALSSAVVAALSDGVDEIDLIETAILPGNRAPRGLAVIDSILHQAGTDIDVTIDGVAEPLRSWSASQMFDLPKRIKRRGFMIRVPDQSLFPDFFKARSVTFYAGLEVGVMNHGLAAFAWLRHKLGFGIAPWFSKAMRWAANLLHGLGTDAGGMTVRVICRTGDHWENRIWRLLVRKEEGPYVPAVSVRAVLRNPALITPGARPGLVAYSLGDAEAAMEDLAAETVRETRRLEPLFAQVLGEDIDTLDPAVQASHQTYGPRRWTGTAKITRGAGVWPAFLARMFGFPKATEATPVTVLKTPQNGQETWERRFGDQVFRSRLTQGPKGMREAFGPFSFDLGLHVDAGGLHFPVTGGRLFGVPLPKVCLPISEARETEVNGVFQFDVALRAPLTGQLIVHYRGHLRRDI